MDSVMNFLADNYIWFFVAAGVLLFALIGFIIDSKKKQKSEFKGESIEENKEEPVVVGETTSVGGEAVLGSSSLNNESTSEIAEQSSPSENTMEINDIPLAEENNNNNNNNSIGSRVEFGSNETEPLTEELNLEEKPEVPIEELDLEDNNGL